MNLSTWQRYAWATIGLVLAAAIAVILGNFGWTGAAGIVAVGLVLVAWLKPETAFIFSLLTIIIGQLIRVPIAGGESGVIMNDVLLPALIVVWALRRLASREWPIPSSSLTWPILAVMFFMALSLGVNHNSVLPSEWLTGSLYTVRWIEYVFVLLMGYEYCRNHSRSARYLNLIIIISATLAVLGFVQLRLFPDFSFMVPQGWDPHVGRLLSTWFDPNFLAGFFAVMTTVALSVALSKPFIVARWWWFAIALMTLAMVLTFSRSGYVALAIGAGLVTLIRARTIFFLGLIGFAAIVVFVPRVQERVIGIRTIDETAQLRIVSWQNALSVIEDHPWFGVGYNLYAYTQVRYGFLSDTQEHSASGSDSSLLTIWVTTGTLGLAAYAWLILAMLREAFRTWRDRSVPPEWQAFGLGVFGALIAMIFHSIFVNSFVYPHIMQTLWLLLAMVIMVRQPRP